MMVFKTIKNLTEKLKENSLVREVQNQPALLGQWLEQKNPKLGKAVLSVASEFLSPPLMGSGIKVEDLGDDQVKVSLPCRWKNKPYRGGLDGGTLVSAGEFACRLIWDRHLDSGRHRLDVTAINFHKFHPMTENVQLSVTLAPSDKDKCIYKLFSEGKSEVVMIVAVVGESGRLLSQVEFQFELHGDMALPGKR